MVSGFAALAGKDGKLVGEGWPTRGTNYAGADDPRYPMAQGRPPAAAGEVAIDAHTAARTGYRVGDTIRLSVSGPVIEERVAGVFTTDDGSVSAGGTLTLFDTATAQSLFAKPGRYNQIELRAQPGTPPSRYVGRRKALCRTGSRPSPRPSCPPSGRERRERQLVVPGTARLRDIALFVGNFLIVNTFTMLIAQRTKELALLRAVGASRRQVTLSVLAEAAMVGLVAGAAGLIAGIGIAAAVRVVLSSGGGTLPTGRWSSGPPRSSPR